MRSDHVRVIVAVLWLSLLAALVACAQLVTPPGNELIGGVNEPVAEGIPSLDFVAREDDYSEDHPDLPGVPVSFNTLALVFNQGVTVGQAQGLLDDIEAEIVGGIPGVNGEAEGILFLRVPTAGHQGMIDLLARLRADPLVKHAVQDGLLSTMLVPQPNGGTPAWTWQAAPAGGNWGMERIRAPQLWNLNAAVAKSDRTTPTGVLDVGFANAHEDLVYDQNLTVGTQADHGTHVAGTVAATFDNGVGVDGVNPFADLVVSAPAFSGSGTALNVRTSWGQQMSSGFFGLINARNDVRVVNASLGYNWGPAGINQNTSAAVHDLVEDQGSIFALAELIHLLLGKALPLFVVAAGNDSNDISDGAGGFVEMEARWGSPFAYAGIELGMPNIIVVESVANSAASAGGATRSSFSNLGGDVSAPGSSVLSTSWRSTSPTAFYETMSGTSMASPHVTGLISYLFSVDPTLLGSEIVALLEANSVAVAGGASPRIDAFATVMDIDRVQGNDAVLRMLLDIDDGTPDGNQRVLLPSGSGDFVNEDAEVDGGIGDGAVDMADFRRWRDWLLQVENPAGLTLDGSAGHPKKDVNGNGSVGTPGQENLYPRGDFNGDGQLSRTATRYVPGRVDGTVTDLAVLQELFTDPNYSAAQLPGLIDSADLEIWPADCLARPNVASVESSLRLSGTSSILQSRTHTSSAGPRQVYTAAVDAGGYTARIEGKDAGGFTLFSAEQAFPMALGSDTLWRPDCDVAPSLPDLAITITGPASAAPSDDIGNLIDLLAENSGTATAAGTGSAGENGFMLDVVLSSDQVVPAGFAVYSANYSEDVLLQGGRISNTVDLTAGASQGYPIPGGETLGGVIPADTPPGDYFLCSQIDPGQKIAELNESNNVGCTPIQITPLFTITSYQLSPVSPAELPFSPEGAPCPSGGAVVITGTYEKNVSDPVLIYGRPFTLGSLTQNYGASGSPEYVALTGSFEQSFCLRDDEALERPVDQIRLTIERSGTPELLYEEFVDVDYLFVRSEPRSVCIDFENPPFTLGTQWGTAYGDSPGDPAFTEQGVSVTVENFTSGTYTGFVNAEVRNDGGLPGQSMWISNINLKFDFTGLAFTVDRVTFEFQDLGGSENVAVNASAIVEGELASGTVGGVPLTITRSVTLGEGTLVGTVRDMTIGGQEFYLDNVCAFEVP